MGLYLWGFGRKCCLSRQPLYDCSLIHRVAEITSGITCGCLPVLPQFFRHFGPIVTSWFRFNHGKSQGTSPTKCTGIPKPAQARAPIHDPWGSRSLNNSYIELVARDESRRISGNSTTIKAEMPRLSDYSGGVEDHKTHEIRDVESGAPLIGVRRTVRAETSDIYERVSNVEHSCK